VPDRKNIPFSANLFAYFSANLFRATKLLQMGLLSACCAALGRKKHSIFLPFFSRVNAAVVGYISAYERTIKSKNF
jgi:hypothetical protein